MSWSRRETLAAMASGAGALTLAGCGEAVSGKLRIADAHPQDYPTVRAVQFFADRLAERTEGRLVSKLYSGGVLGQEKDTLEITIFGGLDFNRVNLAPLNSIAPETVIPNLPFLFGSVEHMRRAMAGPPGRKILQSLEPHGLVGLAFYDSGARSFYTTERPVLTPEDLAGQKIRVQSSDLYVSMVGALGGNATPMDFSEVYQGLLQGTVDGAENNWPSYEMTRHFEVATYYSLTRHVMAPEVLVMSARAWAQVSEDDRQIMREVAAESQIYMSGLWDERVAQARATIEASTVEVFEPDLAPFREKVKPVWDRYIATPEMARLVEEIRAYE